MDMRTPSWPHTIRIIVFSLLIGGVSGVLGTALTNNYLSNYTFQLNQITEPLRLDQERPRSLPESYADAVTRLGEQVLPAIGGLYQTSTTNTEGYAREKSSSTATVMTSDGWFITQGASARDLIQVESHECMIDQVIEDERTGLQFAHCPTNGLSVVDFGKGHDLQAGDQVFVAQAGESLLFTQIQQVRWGEDIVRSSDTPLRHMVLDHRLSEQMYGAPVVNMFGELVGFVGLDVAGDLVVLPFEQIAATAEQVLQGETEISYPYLGVNGIELAHMVGIDESIHQGSAQGLLLYGDVATRPQSPARDAGLLEGDIILSIDGEGIGASLMLADALAGYQAGDSVSLEIMRDGERADMQVTLGTLE